MWSKPCFPGQSIPAPSSNPNARSPKGNLPSDGNPRLAALAFMGMAASSVQDAVLILVLVLVIGLLGANLAFW